MIDEGGNFLICFRVRHVQICLFLSQLPVCASLSRTEYGKFEKLLWDISITERSDGIKFKSLRVWFYVHRNLKHTGIANFYVLSRKNFFCLTFRNLFSIQRTNSTCEKQRTYKFIRHCVKVSPINNYFVYFVVSNWLRMNLRDLDMVYCIDRSVNRINQIKFSTYETCT